MGSASDDDRQLERQFGILFSDFRTASGRTQRDFAAAVGWSQSKLSRLERGDQSPTLRDVVDFAEVYGGERFLAAWVNLNAEILGVETALQDKRGFLAEAALNYARTLAGLRKRAKLTAELDEPYRVIEQALVDAIVEVGAHANAEAGTVIPGIWNDPTQKTR